MKHHPQQKRRNKALQQHALMYHFKQCNLKIASHFNGPESV
jgi:hypothetical protein